MLLLGCIFKHPPYLEYNVIPGHMAKTHTSLMLLFYTVFSITQRPNLDLLENVNTFCKS